MTVQIITPTSRERVGFFIGGETMDYGCIGVVAGVLVGWIVGQIIWSFIEHWGR